MSSKLEIMLDELHHLTLLKEDIPLNVSGLMRYAYLYDYLVLHNVDVSFAMQI